MLTFVPGNYHSGLVYALLDNSSIAHYHESTGPTKIRWYHLKGMLAGYMEDCESVEGAQKLITEWVAGLEIVPWNAG